MNYPVSSWASRYPAPMVLAQEQIDEFEYRLVTFSDGKAAVIEMKSKDALGNERWVSNGSDYEYECDKVMAILLRCAAVELLEVKRKLAK